MAIETYRDEPFVLAKDVTQVFYVQDMSSKPRKDKSRNKSSFLGAGDETKRHIILVDKKKLWESTMSQMKKNTIRLKIGLRSQWRLTQVFC